MENVYNGILIATNAFVWRYNLYTREMTVFRDCTIRQVSKRNKDGHSEIYVIAERNIPGLSISPMRCAASMYDVYYDRLANSLVRWTPESRSINGSFSGSCDSGDDYYYSTLDMFEKFALNYMCDLTQKLVEGSVSEKKPESTSEKTKYTKDTSEKNIAEQWDAWIKESFFPCEDCDENRNNREKFSDLPKYKSKENKIDIDESRPWGDLPWKLIGEILTNNILNNQ